MVIDAHSYAEILPLPPIDKWQQGVWDVEALRHGTMSLIYFAPEGIDYQTPHDQDEIYIVLEGSGMIEIEGDEHPFSPGSAIFVRAGQSHRFVGEIRGLKMWAIFYGPKGGEVCTQKL